MGLLDDAALSATRLQEAARSQAVISIGLHGEDKRLRSSLSMFPKRRRGDPPRLGQQSLCCLGHCGAQKGTPPEHEALAGL